MNFEATFTKGKAKYTVLDSIDMYAVSAGVNSAADIAKSIFLHWAAKNDGIRGNSGVFFPLAGYGSIKITEVKEIHA